MTEAIFILLLIAIGIALVIFNARQIDKQRARLKAEGIINLSDIQGMHPGYVLDMSFDGKPRIPCPIKMVYWRQGDRFSLTNKNEEFGISFQTHWNVVLNGDYHTAKVMRSNDPDRVCDG